MEKMGDYISEYKKQLEKGQIQKAYKGIMGFMSGLRLYLGKKHPDFILSNLYFGYMDMTYFAFTPPELKEKKLKIAIVYLHEHGKFEIWLGGINRKIQSQFIKLLTKKDLGIYELSPALPGVDSIIEATLVEKPDFDNSLELKKQIEKKVFGFIKNISNFL